MRFPGDWFWFVGDDETRAFSSALAAYVPAEIIPEGEPPTRIASEAELAEVLLQHGLPLGSLPRPVPAFVSRMQARTVLRHAGLLGVVDAAIRASGDADLIGLWDDASHFHRDHAKLEAFWLNSLGKTVAELDQFYIAAAQVS